MSLRAIENRNRFVHDGIKTYTYNKVIEAMSTTMFQSRVAFSQSAPLNSAGLVVNISQWILATNWTSKGWA